MTKAILWISKRGLKGTFQSPFGRYNSVVLSRIYLDQTNME